MIPKTTNNDKPPSVDGVKAVYTHAFYFTFFYVNMYFINALISCFLNADLEIYYYYEDHANPFKERMNEWHHLTMTTLLSL